MRATLYNRLNTPVGILPLVVLRVAFGLLMFASTVRFLVNGWVHTFYIAPSFHFTYYGFGWVRPLPEPWLISIYVLIALLSLCIAAGLYYRASIVLFFFLFTYTELLDKTYYLNHYYFISLLSFLLIWLPLHRAWSLDVWRSPALYRPTIPAWTLGVFRLQLGLVYVFAGIAKLKSDWLLEGLPLRIWLLEHTNFPLLGAWFDQRWFALLMSWAGTLYDLTIPLWLLCRRTRLLAYGAVIGFHMMTAMLFPIGMFPWIMIACTLVFFDEQDYQNMWLLFQRLRHFRQTQPAPIGQRRLKEAGTAHQSIGHTKLVAAVLLCFFAAQFVLPLRHWLYPGNVTWTDEGFRFAWNVMLVEKTGHATFFVHDPVSDREWDVYPNDYLTYQQEKQMAFQPDMILAFAHHLEEQFVQQGYPDVAVRAEVYVSLNGRPSQLLIDPTVDLTQEQNSLAPKTWILAEGELGR
ncbi:MAG: HTTM domain-containing protein [Chloroflexota bacterium]